MASQTVYIYPNGTADPDTGDGSYTTMALMEAGENGDLTADNDYLDVIITPSDGNWAVADGSPVTFDGWICDRADNEYINIRTIGTARNAYSDGLWNVTAYRLEHAGADEAIYIVNGVVDQIDIDFDGVQITQKTNADQLFLIGSTTAGSRINFNSCYLWQQSADVVFRGLGADSDNITWCTNCIIRGGTVSVRNVSGAAVYLYNCTVTAAATLGIQAEASGNHIRVVNCAVFDTGNDFHGSFAAGHPKYSACDDAESGANNCVDISPANGDEDSKHDLAFVDHDNGDYRVKAGSVLIDAGLDRTTDPNVPSTDIAGTARPDGSEDIGAFEYVAVGAVTLAMKHAIQKHIASKPILGVAGSIALALKNAVKKDVGKILSVSGAITLALKHTVQSQVAKKTILSVAGAITLALKHPVCKYIAKKIVLTVTGPSLVTLIILHAVQKHIAAKPILSVAGTIALILRHAVQNQVSKKIVLSVAGAIALALKHVVQGYVAAKVMVAGRITLALKHAIQRTVASKFGLSVAGAVTVAVKNAIQKTVASRFGLNVAGAITLALKNAIQKNVSTLVSLRLKIGLRVKNAIQKIRTLISAISILGRPVLGIGLKKFTAQATVYHFPAKGQTYYFETKNETYTFTAKAA